MWWDWLQGHRPRAGGLDTEPQSYLGPSLSFTFFCFCCMIFESLCSQAAAEGPHLSTIKSSWRTQWLSPPSIGFPFLSDVAGQCYDSLGLTVCVSKSS